MRVPFRIVVESSEAIHYKNVIGTDRVLVLPFSNLGQGSIPARNWIWEHSIAEGHQRHWILDDNIRGCFRLNRNQKISVKSGVFFLAMESFVDRYINIPIAGPNYQWFVPARETKKPFTPNTRIYSCILLSNNTSLRWRGRYNEDTDLSIRFLKQGQCSILFNAFLIGKISTMIMSGGNTDILYRQTDNFDGRLAMALSLRQQHPDIVSVTRRWGRWQHLVDYKPFKGNTLIKRKDYHGHDGVNEFGMELKHGSKAKANGVKNARRKSRPTTIA